MTEQAPTVSFFRRWRWVIVGLVVAIATVVLLAPAASDDPDGLDRVSGDQGFAEKAKDSPYDWLPDYSIPGVDNESVSVVLAGAVGVVIVFALTLGFGALVRQSRGSTQT